MTYTTTALALFVTIIACEAGCSQAAEDDAGGSSAAVSAPKAAAKSATCEGQYRLDVWLDQKTDEQTFDLTVNAGAVASFGLPADEAGLTLTAKNGGRAQSYTVKDAARWVLVGNESNAAQTYQVTVKRTGAAQSGFTLECYPVAGDGEPSGLPDKAFCAAGDPCVKTTPDGAVPAVCDGTVYADLSNHAAGGAALGQCF